MGEEADRRSKWQIKTVNLMALDRLEETAGAPVITLHVLTTREEKITDLRDIAK